MNLENIIYVTGKSGLYQIISKGKNMIVGESLIDKKRTPLHLNNQTTVLKDIGIYTYNETKPLEDIFKIIANKEQYKEITNMNSLTKEEIRIYFKEIIPEYDEERVYLSDMKKVIKWYNILCKCEFIKKSKKNNE
tara:strand:+ start:111 stop:515 length:405 start_codon:yes stop_codon:yes gene_type:complete